jgi:hypothetical protein
MTEDILNGIDDDLRGFLRWRRNAERRAGQRSFPLSANAMAGSLGALSHVDVRQGAVKNVAATILAGMLRATLGSRGRVALGLMESIEWLEDEG